MAGAQGKAMRFVAAMLIVAQALAPAAAWAQTTRTAPPPAPVPAAKGPVPAEPAAASPTKGPVVDRRLALVVGNNTYKNAPLVNPINDARLVAKTLEGLGFEVMLRENLNLRDFKATMRQFASRLENEEGTGLLYYAGHGVQIEGRNFLLPIDVGAGDEYELRDSAVDLEDTLMSRLVRARKREKIIILDACRDNPFRAPNQQSRALLLRGFAQMGSEKGSLIVYSTNPGNTAEDGTGKNSVFTEIFVREIQKDGIEVGQALRSTTSAVVGATKGRQTPWYNSSLLGEFYFRPVNVRLEEERRKKEVQQQVETALKSAREDLKRDESGRIEAAVAARIAERERGRQERERQYNAQIAEMKALLERRDKDLESARVQMAMAGRTRDEQLAALASAEAERRRLERERPVKAEVERPPAAVREQEDAARKKADPERVARETREREAREEREGLIRLEAQRQAAAEKAQRAEAERQAKAAAEIVRREAAAKTKREKEERDRLVQAEAKRKETERARREESARQANAAAEKIRAFEEQARQTAAQDRLASDEAAARDTAKKQQREPDNAEAARLAVAKVKRAKEDADRAIRDAETTERLAGIEADVRRKASLEFEMLNRKASLPPELAALMVVEPEKAVVAGSNGDFVVRGVRLPADVVVKPAAPNVPANCAAFLGAWGGGRWNGERTAEIWVESVDADCRARAIYARGGLSLSGEPASHLRGGARISGDRLTLDLSAVRIELTRDGSGMAGRWSSGVNSATAPFERVPSTPDRTVALFANEAADYGASPSRVISASQVSDRVMLALPTTVPAVDTLTTLQLEAFLKTHPDAVLVDAVVGSAHRTLPGAYWLPELGVVTIGQLERGQIENALRAASGGDPSRPIIVFERSTTYGWFGYHGVLRLLGMGYRNIYWYRGGLDAWHDAQFALAQAQPWAKAQ
jgi:PQQ-dependent catabolism-associated CXXCW motif protein